MEGLPCKPEKPLDSDCCGQGCDPCVLDIYEEELAIWESDCRRIRNRERPQPQQDQINKWTGPVLLPTEYRTFIIEEIHIETTDCKRYRFTLPNSATLGLKTGQHIIIRAEIDGEIITRQYTPVSDVGLKSSFELLVKVYKTGKISPYVKQWNVGTAIEMRGPSGLYEYNTNKYRTLYMFAVGTGIAPMAQVIQTILGNEDDETLIQLHYGCRTYDDILLKSWIDDWARYWNFSCTYYLSQESNCDTKQYRYGDVIHKTRIGKDILKSVIKTDNVSSFILICGTKSFEKHTIQCLDDMGFPKERFHKF